MKLTDILLERKLSTSEYAYHATKGEYLPSILKHGLIPNKKSGGYGSGDKDAYFGYDLTSLPGIYFTVNANDAQTIAKSVSGESPSIIIIAKIQKRTADLDEDNITKNIIRNIDVRDVHRINPNGALEHLTQSTLAEIKRYNNNKDFIQYITPHVKNYIRALLSSSYISRKNDDPFNEFKTFQNILTKKLKNMLVTDKRNDRFKIDHPISFSGSNRIVGIYSPDTGIGWGDIYDFDRDAYHMTKNPMDIINNKNRA